MWTHCLRHQLVASTFAVSARVRRASCCHPVQGLSVTLQVASKLSIFIWLCSDAFIKRLTATTHLAFLFCFFVKFSFFTERVFVVQLLCVYILKKGVNIEWTNQGCLQSRLQEQASWLFLSIVLNCIGIYCYYICIHCIFFCSTFIHCIKISWFYLL